MTPMVTMRLDDARVRLAELVTTVEQGDARVLVTRDGAPAAVLIGAEELRRLEETIAVLALPGMTDAMRLALRQVETGEVSGGGTLTELMSGRGPSGTGAGPHR
jgi:prevent-host-death family protein